MTPLQSVSSLKLKLGIVILVAVWITAVAEIIAVRWLGLPPIVGAATGIVLALGCVQLLARGTTKPLREMAAVATAMAHGEHGRQVAVTSTDEVGELAHAFNRMTAELAETDRLRRDLVANVSHELRTPLGALQAVLENVVDGVSEADDETLRTMLAQTRRLGRLVSQLLDLSRLEAGEQPFDMRPFAIREVLESAAREARLHAPQDVVFSIDAPAALCAQGDPERIHQVVMNLVENAVRFSPRPGHVALRAAQTDGTVTLEVDDEGPGIAEDDLERVFERFYRGDGRERGRRDGDRGGAGLGLAIARWIVDLHGGTIRAERRDPRGSHMVVTLPRAGA
ncbi:MAG TPA: ATP-binding protein [Solirubrobacteraceae bacterium]|jgi:signal transduction histidine kinase|nr:ATP-binding protein [Solirubrobacteraceae bacterium]